MASKSKSKKVVSKVAPLVTESTTPATVASVNPVPTSVSAPPEGWVEPKKLSKKGRRPRNGLTLAAAGLSSELRTNATAISAELGPKAVDPQQVAAALDTANGWEGAASKAATFYTYARSQRGSSWDAAVTLMMGMKLGVRFALQRDATFADRFPVVAKAFAPTHRPKKRTADGETAPAPKTTSRAKSAAVATEPVATPAEAAAPAPQAAAAETTATA
ncbi:MAG: hypothetical protein ACLQVI_42535 [Polyangiaceae bacterium]